MNTTNQPRVTSNQSLLRVGHCLYRSKESQTYYAILKRAGKQIKRSLKTTDHALARRRLSELTEKAALLGRVENRSMSFAELRERWLEVAGTSMKPSSHLRQVFVSQSLNGVFGQSLVRAITKGQVEKWAATRSKERAARTFNYERQTLIRILDYAMRDGLILENPARVVKRMKQGKQRVVIPTKDQFKTLVETLRKMGPNADEAAHLCEFLAYSGCRLAEGVAVQWGDVAFEAKQFTITGGERGTKNHEVRTVPLFPSLGEFLTRLRDSLAEPPKASARIISIGSGKKAMTSACRNAGLPHFTHHNLRHFFCSNAIEAGVDFKAIAAWLGHKDGGLLVAKTYGHLRDEHSAAMAQRMTFGVGLGG